MRLLPDCIATNLRFKFYAYSAPLALLIGAAVLIMFFAMTQEIVRVLGQRTSTNQVLLDKARAELPLAREYALGEALAMDPALIAWAKEVDHPTLRERGVATLERFRAAFSGKSYFFVPDSTKVFYAYEDTQVPDAPLEKYVLSESDVDDAWYFSTIALAGTCYLNVDYDRALEETKVWVNCNVRDPENDAILGVVGTGLDLTTFVDDLQKSLPPGVTAIYVDKSGAIQAHPNIALIEQDALTKPDNLKSTIFDLVDTDKDRDLLSKAFDEALNTPDKATTTEISIDGHAYLFGISFIPSIDWFSVSVMDLQLLAFDKYFAPLAILFAVTIALSILVLGLALDKTVLKRVDRLDKAVSAFKDGTISGIDAPKDANPDQIGRLRRTFSEMADAVQKHADELEGLVAERTQELEDLVGRDPLTDARNRRSFYDVALEEQKRAARFGGIASVLMLDLDHFKDVNDNHGHAAGDETIKALAELCHETLRDIDIFARMGGEEFAAILINTDLEDAHTVAERIRSGMHHIHLKGKNGTFICTVSIGIALWDMSSQEIDQALSLADHALYEAKQTGRDRTVIHKKPTETPQ